jgi:hypothetical protein
MLNRGDWSEVRDRDAGVCVRGCAGVSALLGVIAEVDAAALERARCRVVLELDGVDVLASVLRILTEMLGVEGKIMSPTDKDGRDDTRGRSKSAPWIFTVLQAVLGNQKSISPRVQMPGPLLASRRIEVVRGRRSSSHALLSTYSSDELSEESIDKLGARRVPPSLPNASALALVVKS